MTSAPGQGLPQPRAPHPDCHAAAAAGLLAAGIRRASAIRRADQALQDDICSRTPLCIRRAMTTLLAGGDLKSADAHWLRLAAVPIPGGDELWPLLRAQLARLAGDFGRAITEFEQLTSASASPPIRQVALPWFVETLVATGDVPGAEARALDGDLDQLVRGTLVNRALHLAARGSLNLAARRFAAAEADFVACGRSPVVEHLAQPGVLRRRGLAALAAHGAGRTEEALTLVAEERVVASRWDAPHHVGWMMAVRGIVDPRGPALDLLTDAADLLEATGGRVELAEVALELGSRLCSVGDLGGARERLLTAEKLARRLGNAPLLARIEETQGKLSEAGQPSALTRQEAKIAKLARAGYSNRQISVKLFLTVRTVEFHLSSVYRKLRVSGRRELLNVEVELG